MRENQADDDFECTRGVPRVGVDCGILRQAAQVYTLKIFKKFQAKYFQGLSWHVTSSKHDSGVYTYTLRKESGHAEHSRWTKSARREVHHDDGGSCSLDLTMSKTYHLNELMRQFFDVMSSSVNDIETVKIAKRKLHELDVEIRNYASSVSKSEKYKL
ncbi:hypothetical protein SASPL_122159 [Salvia splendens]|uniref:Protein FAR1-RELATED SEQUENCE n=1 Tax=Salvia splendens TaxID=180675 RepID=A0A8X8XMH1_SALSN|nr:hypothetical protein SASPL_122159 [Salvia splendens]